jgi:hypothetical protein
VDEERQVRPGFLPPQAPTPRQHTPYAPPERPVFVGRESELGPSSGLAIAGTAVGSIALLLLVLSLGLGYPVCGLLSLSALLLGVNARRRIKATGKGRPGQAKAAIWVGAIGLILAIVAAIVWAGLDASGFSPDDLRQWLEDRLEEQRSTPTQGRPSGDLS